MAKLYNEKSVKGMIDKTRYERAHRLELHNPLGRLPQVIFRTSWVERDNVTGEERQLDMLRTLSETYDPNELFDIIDEEGQVVGQADYRTVFGLLYSLFFHVAAKEDGNG